MYNIIRTPDTDGTTTNNEIIDTAESKEEAQELCWEYITAFNTGVVSFELE